MAQPSGVPNPAGKGGGSSTQTIAMAAGAVAIGLVIVAGAWALFFRGSSDSESSGSETATVSSVLGAEEATPGDFVVATPADLETCGESDLLSIPDSNVSIEPVTYEEERAYADANRDAFSMSLTPKDDPATQQFLNDILADMMPDFADASRYSVTLIDNDIVNAFAIPGGEIFVTDSLVDLMDSDEIAFTVAHELAHELCRHPAKSMEKLRLLDAATAAASDQLGIDVGAILSEEDAAQAAIMFGALSFSREDEYEADRMAVVLMRENDYPLEGCVGALQALKDFYNEDGTPHIEVLSSHPITDNRIEAVQYQVDNG